MSIVLSLPFIEQVSLFIEICISCHTFLHLTKMTFHRIVLFVKHRPFTETVSVKTGWLNIEVANAFYRLNDCWKSFDELFVNLTKKSFLFSFSINLCSIEMRGEHRVYNH